jgi:hypothetical protein
MHTRFRHPPSTLDADWGPDGRREAVDLDALGECLGYRVDDPNGRVGTVDGVVAGAWTDRPDAIEVRVGLFQMAILTVPADAVADVLRARRRVILRETVDLADAYIPSAGSAPS